MGIFQSESEEEPDQEAEQLFRLEKPDNKELRKIEGLFKRYPEASLSKTRRLRSRSCAATILPIEASEEGETPLPSATSSVLCVAPDAMSSVATFGQSALVAPIVTAPEFASTPPVVVDSFSVLLGATEDEHAPEPPLIMAGASSIVTSVERDTQTFDPYNADIEYISPSNVVVRCALNELIYHKIRIGFECADKEQITFEPETMKQALEMPPYEPNPWFGYIPKEIVKKSADGTERPSSPVIIIID